MTAIALVSIILIGAIAVQAALRTETAPTTPQTRTVNVASVADLTATQTTIPLTGTVSSRSEARIRTQTQGEITRVYRDVGDRVGAGAVIAELGNASERASVQQARGQLEAARANLAQSRAGARTEQRAILQENVHSAEQSLEEARTAARNTLFDSRSTLDTAIRIRADRVFNNPQSDDPRLAFNANNLKLAVDVEFRRLQLQDILADWNTAVESLDTSSDLRARLNEAEDVAGTVRTFLEDLTSLVNGLQPNANLSANTIDTWQNALSTARQEVITLASSISSARGSLAAKHSALENARQNLQEGVSGGRPEEIAAREAAVTQAQGQLASAQAQLEKTIVRSPITGTINTLSIDQGDFVQAFTLAAVVSNNRSLQVETAISPGDRDTISVGNAATIAGQYDGSVTSIAPGVDSETGKIEVTIGVSAPDANLAHGDTVRVEVQQNASVADTSNGAVTLPISAIKVTGRGMFVFTLDENNRLVAHEVELGTLSGETVRVHSGITSDMRIVTDARGLNEGETVRVSE